MPKNWIQGAIKKPGALRATVLRKYGAKGFQGKDKSKIRPDILRQLAKSPGTTGRRARLAKTLKTLNR